MTIIYSINFNKVEGYTPEAYEQICKLTKPDSICCVATTTSQIIATNPSLYNFTEDECDVLDSIVKIINLIKYSIWAIDDNNEFIQAKKYSLCYIAVLAENAWGQYLDTFGKNEQLLHPNNVDCPSLIQIRPFLENITTLVYNIKNYIPCKEYYFVLRDIYNIKNNPPLM